MIGSKVAINIIVTTMFVKCVQNPNRTLKYKWRGSMRCYFVLPCATSKNLDCKCAIIRPKYHSVRGGVILVGEVNNFTVHLYHFSWMLISKRFIIFSPFVKKCMAKQWSVHILHNRMVASAWNEQCFLNHHLWLNMVLLT